LSDLRNDKGMGWVPASMWLSYLRLDVPARDLRFDLAVDAQGTGRPSPAAAGLPFLHLPRPAGHGRAGTHVLAGIGSADLARRGLEASRHHGVDYLRVLRPGPAALRLSPSRPLELRDARLHRRRALIRTSPRRARGAAAAG